MIKKKFSHESFISSILLYNSDKTKKKHVSSSSKEAHYLYTKFVAIDQFFVRFPSIYVQ